MRGMQILAFDTSTAWLSVALFDGRDAIALRERAGSAASERILPLVADLLARGGTRLARLDGIAYGAGPGAFTGIRMACGVAQGLAFGSGLPVFGVPTLGAIAQSAWHVHGWTEVVACLDARMREVYVAAYRRHDNGWDAVRGPVVRKPGEVSAPSDGAWHGAGEGFDAYPALAEQLGLAACDASLIPDAESVARFAWPAVLAGEGMPAEQAQPLYVRHRVALTSAERAAGERL
jgi:tRNA threonylcarbamoyladenosine biosynthesis protein TsaB